MLLVNDRSTSTTKPLVADAPLQPAQRVVLVMHAGGEADGKPPQPIVIDAFEFKHDKEGYLSAASRSHLYLFDVRSGACEALTADSGKNELHPAWSPDGEQIAYVSDPMQGPAQTAIEDLEVIAARAGSPPQRLLTIWSPNYQRLQWSPDGTQLAFLRGVEGKGIADPARLGVGGWSYGGLLTDYLIASDTRFKAAISGAGSGNQLSMYGSDEYIVQYNAEMGPPWRNPAVWLKVSYPFFHADRIRTPTLFMSGDKDFDVPVAGGEQMYQALRTLGVPAQLVVYPGEYHVPTRPSFLVDRSRRYLDWMEKYLKGQPY